MGAARSGETNNKNNRGERRAFQPRVKGEPGKFSCYVRYSIEGRNRVSPGVFADVSANGMRVISRGPSRVRIGDVLTIEFGLPNDEKTFTKRAKVVRRINDFIFAVQFLSPATELHPAVSRFAAFVRRSHWREIRESAAVWLSVHKQGVILSAVGFVLALIVGTWIYLGSDQYLGRPLRPWGTAIPQQWYWDYYNKIPGAPPAGPSSPADP